MNVIKPNWCVPKHVFAYSTLRQGGVSVAPYESFNLGDHVGDDEKAVNKNRTLLVEALSLPQMPTFLNQVHGTQVATLPVEDKRVEADAVYTDRANQVCLVMTADCLPVLFTSQQGNEVAAAHAGWRGLCEGILEQTVAKFRCPTEQINVWLGPAIGPTQFQVGREIVEQFCLQDEQAALAFTPDLSAPDKYLANLYLLATQRLNKLGISQITGGEHCTFLEQDKFFSYRREKQTGRMATLVWFTE